MSTVAEAIYYIVDTVLYCCDECTIITMNAESRLRTLLEEVADHDSTVEHYYHMLENCKSLPWHTQPNFCI